MNVGFVGLGIMGVRMARNLLRGGHQLAVCKRAKLETHVYEPEFPLRWQQKDLHLACATAWENGVPMPVINAAKEVFMLAAAEGLRDLDFSAVAELYRRKG